MSGSSRPRRRGCVGRVKDVRFVEVGFAVQLVTRMIVLPAGCDGVRSSPSDCLGCSFFAITSCRRLRNHRNPCAARGNLESNSLSIIRLRPRHRAETVCGIGRKPRGFPVVRSGPLPSGRPRVHDPSATAMIRIETDTTIRHPMQTMKPNPPPPFTK